MLRYRLIIGPLMAVLLLGATWLDEVIDRLPVPRWLGDWTGAATWPPGVILFSICSLGAVLGGRELARLLRAKGIAAAGILTEVAALLGVVSLALMTAAEDAVFGSMVVTAVVGVTMFSAMAYYARTRDLHGVATATAGAVFSFVFIGLMLGAIVAMRREHSAWVIAWVIYVTKLGDVGAFFVGRAIGRHKMAPWLSPGKTWEGLGGAIVMSCIISVVWAWIMRASGVVGAPGLVMSVLCGGVFAVVGHVGDLMVSVLKRDAGAKDAGQSVPGFGGVLDVLDSVLLVGPVAYWALRIAGLSG